jgi:signal transduction histidine kinase
VAVEFSVVGPVREVSAEVGLVAYRTAQEALTNARRHAPGQPVQLSVEFAATELAVTVVNPLSGTSAVPADAGPASKHAPVGSGYGLIGLQERAAQAGGTLAAGPVGGEWHVRLRIPA